MKRSILFFIALLLLVISADAQRRHNHFKRIRIEKQEVTEYNPIDSRSETDHSPVKIQSAETSTLHVLPELKPVNTGLMRLKSKNKHPQTLIIVQPSNPQEFWNKVFEVHEKLRKVEETEDAKKTMLRTWKWLLIVCAIFVALAVFFIILGYLNSKYSGLILAGYIIGPLFFIAGIIVTILGISGRI